MDINFWRDKKVFVTGHTGFKGAWLTFMLNLFGAKVTGYALKPPTTPNLFSLIDGDKISDSIEGDIRDLDKLQSAFEKSQPEIVFHLAAQPIVLEGYKNPAATYSTNIMGTVNILECVRKSPSVKSFLNVTTDKVYYNNEWVWGYRESDLLDGIDPYSNSKSCSELVTNCYRRSFFKDGKVAISTARAGNVIGGGDFAEYRIIPDCVRAALVKEKIQVRNPNSVRPYQHVLEPLLAYMMIAAAQYKDRNFAGNYNVGPEENDNLTTGELTEIFCKNWGENLTWQSNSVNQPREANFLRLDCSKIKSVFDWTPKWDIRTAIEKTVAWYKVYRDNGDVAQCMRLQIQNRLTGGVIGRLRLTFNNHRRLWTMKILAHRHYVFWRRSNNFHKNFI